MHLNLTKNTQQTTYLLLILTTVIWGIQPLCIKLLVTQWTPITITAMRYYLIGTALIWIAVIRGENFIPPTKCWIPLALMGVTGIGLNNVMQFTGLQYSTVTNCTLIAASSPAITALFASIWIREKLNLIAWLGIIVSFIGALIVVSHGSIDMIIHFDFNKGDILFFSAQIAWTVYSIIALKVMKEISAALTTGWAGLSGAIITTIYGSISGDFNPHLLNFSMMSAFAYTVVFGGIMAMLFWNIGVKNAGPSVTSIFQNITPVVGMIGGTLIFNEIIGFKELLGALAIFIGVYLTTHNRSLMFSVLRFIIHHRHS